VVLVPIGLARVVREDVTRRTGAKRGAVALVSACTGAAAGFLVIFIVMGIMAGKSPLRLVILGSCGRFVWCTLETTHTGTAQRQLPSQQQIF
jgi:hypothetical protein